MASERQHPGDPETEYKEVCNNLRFYGDLRFKQMATLLTLSAALLVWNSARSTPSVFAIPVAIGGIFATLLFIVVERSSCRYWNHFLERAQKLEHVLEFEQYQTAPRGTNLTNSAAKATMMLYWLVAFIWSLFLASALNTLQ